MIDKSVNNMLIGMDAIVNDGIVTLNKTINKTLVSILKSGTDGNITEAMTLNPTSGIYSYKFQPIYTAVTDWNKQIVRDITKMLNSELDSLASYLNIEIPRINFIKEIQNNILNFSNQIPNNVRQEFLNYVSMTIIEPTTVEMLSDISNLIGKSLKQTDIIMRESLTVINRDFINKQYKKYETKETLYQFIGANDSKMSKDCAYHINMVKTRNQWESIKGDIFINGFHFQCRHSLVQVDIDDESLDKPK